MSGTPAWLSRARSGWKYRGASRPSFAVEPKEGQESCWDYPRPPGIVPSDRAVVVRTLDGATELARTRVALRVCETASPPTWYIPAADVDASKLKAVAEVESFCEWKGRAKYWALKDGNGRPVAWSYPKPLEGSESMAGMLCFYPDRVQCFVEEERVRAQAGGFYGGWITDDICGPFKGDPETQGW